MCDHVRDHGGLPIILGVSYLGNTVSEYTLLLLLGVTSSFDWISTAVPYFVFLAKKFFWGCADKDRVIEHPTCVP